MTRAAWCATCRDVQTCDERGCIVCRAMRDKQRESNAKASREQRARNAAAGLCINGRLHPKPKHGVRCDKCIEVHRRSAS